MEPWLFPFQKHRGSIQLGPFWGGMMTCFDSPTHSGSAALMGTTPIWMLLGQTPKILKASANSRAMWGDLSMERERERARAGKERHRSVEHTEGQQGVKPKTKQQAHNTSYGIAYSNTTKTHKARTICCIHISSGPLTR